MIIKKVDPKYKYKSIFDTATGNYIRTGILDSDGKDTGKDPFMSSFPELIDIGIMGHCIHGLSGRCKVSGVECYQHGDISTANNMCLDAYKSIIDECTGKVFQVALGGCGDPNKHENFAEILQYTRNKNIVPNYTTSGFDITDSEIELSKKYCGAVAVSAYQSLTDTNNSYTAQAITKLIKSGITTNIHYVLSNASIDSALQMLKNPKELIPSGINAIIFLIHKPVGLGTQGNVLSLKDPRVKEFFSLVDTGKYNFRVGFDSCSIPGIINLTSHIDPNSIEACEAARWSMYISSDLVALPCSFDNQAKKYAVQLKQNEDGSIKEGEIQKAWDSEIFEKVRKILSTRCISCNKRELCLGGCPLMEEIVLCDRKENIL